MGVSAPLRTALRLSSGTARRRAVVVSAIALIERLLAPALAYVWVFQGPIPALVVGVGLGAIVTVRRAAERSFAARNGAELYQRAVQAVLASDVLQAGLLPDEEALGRLFEGLHHVPLVLAETLPNLVANVVAAAVVAGIVAVYEPLDVTLVAGLALLLGGTVLFASRRTVERVQAEAWQAWERVAEGLTDACEGRLELVAAGRDAEFLDAFVAQASSWDDKARRAGRISGLLGRLPIAALAAAVAGAVVLDAWLHGVPWSVSGARAILLASGAPAFLGIARGLQELVSHDPRLRFVAKILEGGVRSRAGAAVRDAPPGIVEWRAVRFAYGRDGEEALRGVSFEWRAGELLALAGPNGSGKSTCLRALLGLGEPNAGDVRIDGAPLAELDMARWRRAIAFLPQRPYLPPRLSVRQCLRFLDGDAPEEAMRTALERVGMQERLARAGADPLAVRVGSLSVGERQRVALARVLCHRAPLVLLDEPDANLDSDGIGRVAAIVLELARERMVLVVAHTSEVLRVADRVVTLENGRVRSDVERNGREPTRGPARPPSEQDPPRRA